MEWIRPLLDGRKTAMFSHLAAALGATKRSTGGYGNVLSNTGVA
jgi:hypothetical protein